MPSRSATSSLKVMCGAEYKVSSAGLGDGLPLLNPSVCQYPAECVCIFPSESSNVIPMSHGLPVFNMFNPPWPQLQVIQDFQCGSAQSYMSEPVPEEPVPELRIAPSILSDGAMVLTGIFTACEAQPHKSMVG